MLPDTRAAEELRELTLRVTNPTQSFFTSVPPAPIFVSYKWLDLEDGSLVDPRRAHRSKLPHTLRPDESADVVVRIVAPARPGTVLLRMIVPLHVDVASLAGPPISSCVSANRASPGRCARRSPMTSCFHAYGFHKRDGR
jgi:hypothetical protein